MHYIIFPLHEKSHWILAYLNNENSTFSVLDPYFESQSSFAERRDLLNQDSKRIHNSIQETTQNRRREKY